MGTKIGLFLVGLLAGILLMIVVQDASEPVRQKIRHNKAKETSNVVDTLFITQRDTVIEQVYIEVEPKDTTTEEIDSTNQVDSIILDTLVQSSLDSLENTRSNFTTIEQEELLFSKVLHVLPDEDRADSAKIAIDSLLEKQTGIEPTPSFINLEFWDHPFYKAGYIKNGKVIRVYGVVPDKQATLHTLNNQLYLGFNGSFYSVENTFNLLPLVTETDSLILIQLLEN